MFGFFSSRKNEKSKDSRLYDFFTGNPVPTIDSSKITVILPRLYYNQLKNYDPSLKENIYNKRTELSQILDFAKLNSKSTNIISYLDPQQEPELLAIFNELKRHHVLSERYMTSDINQSMKYVKSNIDLQFNTKQFYRQIIEQMKELHQNDPSKLQKLMANCQILYFDCTIYEWGIPQYSPYTKIADAYTGPGASNIWDIADFYSNRVTFKLPNSPYMMQLGSRNDLKTLFDIIIN